jgi:hypothetical protein
MTVQVDESIAIYQTGCFSLLSTYLLTKPYNFMIVENNVAMTQLRVLQFIFLFFIFSPIKLSN